MNTDTLISTILIALMVSVVRAGSEMDIHLQVQDGHIVTGLIDASTGTPLLSQQRVFAGTFGEASIPTFTNDPGFFATSGTFPSGSTLGFNILAPLQVWTGSDFSDPGHESITVSFGGGAVSAATSSGFVPGFSLFVQPNGGYHRHLSFDLSSTSGAPDPGIYLLELEKFSSSPAIAASQPFWIVFNYQDSLINHDAAIDWVQTHLANPPPDCPGDLNGDSSVNGVDLGALLAAWKLPVSSADLNDDGIVNGIDLGILLAAWGACP